MCGRAKEVRRQFTLLLLQVSCTLALNTFPEEGTHFSHLTRRKVQ